MAKTISQETFDAVVKENVEDFDMSPQDAVNDAVQQFEAQGVNLSTIVTTAPVSGVHPVVAAIQQLAALSGNTGDVSQLCADITTQCEVSLAQRCLAGRHDAYPTLRDLWASKPPQGVLTAVITALNALCNGQPDLLDPSGRHLAIEALTSSGFPDADLILVLRFIRFNCIQHERNRQDFVNDGLIKVLVNLLDAQRLKKDVVREACHTLRVLTFDDDVRAVFGKAHDHAKMIVQEEGALEKIMEICKDYIQETPILGELFSTLARLAVRNEFCQQIMDLGGLQLMLDTLDKNMQHPGITKQVLGVLKAVAGNDDVKVAIVNNNGVELIISAITTHAVNAGICEIGCSSLATVVLRNPGHCERAMKAGAADILVKVLTLHPAQPNTQKQASRAVRNLVARCPDHSAVFLALDAESLLQGAYQTHPSCGDEAKAALRDLGCDVKLACPWVGTGAQLAQ